MIAVARSRAGLRKTQEHVLEIRYGVVLFREAIVSMLGRLETPGPPAQDAL